jgi:hypothetical protein
MDATVGVYDNHDKAVEAILKLKDSGYPVSKLTLMGLMHEEKVDEESHVTETSPLKPAGLGMGAVIGTTLGVLTGIGVFAIPGVGFLFGAGALAGAIGGFDLGLIAGGLASVLTTLGMKDDIAKRYHNVLKSGKYLVVAHGEKEDISRAKTLLHELGKHESLETH